MGSCGFHCRLMISQQPTYHGDSGGPIVSNNLELVAIVQGGLPVKADVIRDKDGKQVILVEGREGMALNVDVDEIREMVEKTYKSNFNGTFPEIPPLHEPGITPAPTARTTRPKTTCKSSARETRPKPGSPSID